MEAVIYTHNHEYGKAKWRDLPIILTPLNINYYAWIGRRAMIMPNVSYIGECSVIAPASVVTKDIPDYEMWGGNPAKFIKEVEK